MSDLLLSEFMKVTATSAETATHLLEDANFNLVTAVNDFFEHTSKESAGPTAAAASEGTLSPATTLLATKHVDDGSSTVPAAPFDIPPTAAAAPGGEGPDWDTLLRAANAEVARLTGELRVQGQELEQALAALALVRKELEGTRVAGPKEAGPRAAAPVDAGFSWTVAVALWLLCSAVVQCGFLLSRNPGLP